MAYFDFFSGKKKDFFFFFLHPCWVRGTQHCGTPFQGGAYSGLEAWGSGAGAGMGPWAGAGPEAVSEAAGGGRAGAWVEAEAMLVRLALPEVGGPLHCRPLFSSLSFFLISFTSALSCLLSALRRCRSALRTVLSPRLGNLVWNVIRKTYLLTIKSLLTKNKNTNNSWVNLASRTVCIPALHLFLCVFLSFFQVKDQVIAKKLKSEEVSRSRTIYFHSRGFTLILLTSRAQGWREASWFSQGCGLGHGCVGTSHTGCRTGTRWQRKELVKRLTLTGSLLKAACRLEKRQHHHLLIRRYLDWTLLFKTACFLKLDHSQRPHSIPAFVGPFRGGFVTAAAVWGVPEWSIWGGGAWPGSHYTATSPNGLRGHIRRFMGTALPREVAAHPFHDLLHHLVFKLGQLKGLIYVSGS